MFSDPQITLLSDHPTVMVTAKATGWK